MIELSPARRQRRRTLSDRQVRDLPKKRKRYSRVDPELADHVIRIMPDSANLFYAVTRNPYGKLIWHKIGRADQITIAESRERARKALARIKEGKPAVEPVPPPPTSFRSVAENWFQREVVAKKHRTLAETRRCLETYIYPPWADREFVSIRRRDIAELCDAIYDKNGPRQADVVFGIVSRICGWHSLRDENYVNPIVKGMRRAENEPRARILSDDELVRVWRTAETSGVFGAAIQLALLTAQRRSVLLNNMRWDQLDRDVWTIPLADREKNNAGVLRLPKQAMAILERLPRFKGNPFLFAGRGSKPIAGISGLKLKLDKASNTSDWTIHDLRRTARSLMARAGVPRDAAERTLGHAIGSGIERVYDVHPYHEEKAHALRALANLIESIVTGERGDNVVRLQERASKKKTRTKSG
jgi:integrase